MKRRSLLVQCSAIARAVTGHGGARVVLALAAVVAGEGGCDGEVPGDEATVAVTIAALGSSETAQPITNLTQLRTMSRTGNYYLANDIDASATGQSGQAFVPIGSFIDPFRGTLDGRNPNTGQYHVINNLRIATGGWYSGMFSFVDGAIIRNIGLTNVNVSGGPFLGAIAGIIVNSEVTYSYVTGTVSGTGGPLGLAFGQIASAVKVNRFYATGTISGGLASPIGGVAGEIRASGSTEASRAALTEIFTNVNVNPNALPSGTAPVIAGGVVGSVKGGWIIDINSLGPVRGRGYAGGIVGEALNDDLNYMSTNVQDAIARGTVTVHGSSQNRAGGIGHITGDMAHCSDVFWDTTADSGSPPADAAPCQTGHSGDTLKASQPANPMLLYPYIHGMRVTWGGMGSDGEWGAGFDGDIKMWRLNSGTEFSTLHRIPNANSQPK
jgi:hypothetical protein